MEIERQKEEWRYFTMVPGELYVADTGIYWTQLLFVVNSDIFQH